MLVVPPGQSESGPLQRWAALHVEASRLGFPPCTPEYAAQFGGPRWLLHREFEAQTVNQVTAAICALPERLQTALLAELSGGSLVEKTRRACMSRSTFYRTLAEAKAALKPA